LSKSIVYLLFSLLLISIFSQSAIRLSVFALPPPSPAGAITLNLGSTVYTHTSQFNTSLVLNYPAYGPGYKFWVYVDVINVTGLYVYGVGFNFSAQYLHLIQVQNGGFFPTPRFFMNESSYIDNVHGNLLTIGATDSNPAGHSGSGHLIRAEFNVTASPPYTGAYPGSAVPLITLTTNNASLEQTQLIYNDTITDITPPMSQVYDGQFRLNLILHDLAVTNVTASGRVLVGQSIIVNVTIQNKGTCTETFNLTLYGETRQNRTWTILTLIGETLTPGSTKTLTIDVYLDEGTYTLIAYSWPVPGETHTSDNTCTSSTILVAPCPCIGRTFYRPPTPL